MKLEMKCSNIPLYVLFGLRQIRLDVTFPVNFSSARRLLRPTLRHLRQNKKT